MEQIQEILKHIQIINDEMGGMEIKIAILQTQMETLVYWFRIIGAGFVGMFISQVWQILLLKKNGKK